MASVHNALRVSGACVPLCGPCWIAALIWALVHAGPQSIGHPFVENFCNNGVAGCCLA